MLLVEDVWELPAFQRRSGDRNVFKLIVIITIGCEMDVQACREQWNCADNAFQMDFGEVKLENFDELCLCFFQQTNAD